MAELEYLEPRDLEGASIDKKLILGAYMGKKINYTNELFSK
jgi:hypothetical protein